MFESNVDSRVIEFLSTLLIADVQLTPPSNIFIPPTLPFSGSPASFSYNGLTCTSLNHSLNDLSNVFAFITAQSLISCALKYDTPSASPPAIAIARCSKMQFFCVYIARYTASSMLAPNVVKPCLCCSTTGFSGVKREARAAPRDAFLMRRSCSEGAREVP